MIVLVVVGVAVWFLLIVLAVALCRAAALAAAVEPATEHDLPSAARAGGEQRRVRA